MAWFTQCRQNNIPVSGPILKEKSKLFATNLGITNFQASEGWLEKFKKRHDLTFKKVCGESASFDPCISQDWKNELINLLVDYDDRDIFNADEPGLFYKCLPDRTLTFKNEKCHGEVLACMGDVPCKMSILTAMEMVHKAWENVGAQTIVNCFRTCGFIKDGQNIGESIPVQCEEVEVLLSTWNRLEVPVSF
ncbi:hypothetical protein QTP88_001110 [Uroleucon formosanum]